MPRFKLAGESAVYRCDLADRCRSEVGGRSRERVTRPEPRLLEPVQKSFKQALRPGSREGPVHGRP